MAAAVAVAGVGEAMSTINFSGLQELSVVASGTATSGQQPVAGKCRPEWGSSAEPEPKRANVQQQPQPGTGMPAGCKVAEPLLPSPAAPPAEPSVGQQVQGAGQPPQVQQPQQQQQQQQEQPVLQLQAQPVAVQHPQAMLPTPPPQPVPLTPSDLVPAQQQQAQVQAQQPQGTVAIAAAASPAAEALPPHVMAAQLRPILAACGASGAFAKVPQCDCRDGQRRPLLLQSSEGSMLRNEAMPFSASLASCHCFVQASSACVILLLPMAVRCQARHLPC